MLGSSEIDDFLSKLDEISTDSTSVEHYHLQQKKNENKRLKQLLVEMKDSTKEILELYKNERHITISLQKSLDGVRESFNDLQRKFDDLERSSVNEIFHRTQLINEMKESHKQEHEDYIEISKDYFELLSDTTCFLNYELKQHQNKIMSKTERFLRNALGDSFQKLPKVLRSKRRNDDEDGSDVSRVSSRVSKRCASKVKLGNGSKRLKTEIWDMKSISQASSPAGTIPFIDEETSDLSSEICEAESSYSFNTFSIGNETTFSLLQSQKNSPSKIQSCKCHLFAESETLLVSVGTNTDPPVEILESVPKILDDDFELDNDFGSEIGKKILSDFKRLREPKNFVFQFTRCQRFQASSNLTPMKYQVRQVSHSTTVSLNNNSCAIPNNIVTFLADAGDSKEFYLPEFATIATNTEADLITPVKETINQGTSPELILTSDKSTATCRSTTTRGTSTVAVMSKSCGIQFPEINMERIFKETIFELPDCIDPLCEFSLPPEIVQEVPEKVSIGTVTELNNLNREIDFSSKSSVKLKSDGTMEVPQNTEDLSFIILGQTLFDLFLKRIRKYNNSLSDDEITRQKIWKHFKRQLLDRFTELTFDESLNVSFSDSEGCENMVDDLNVNMDGDKADRRVNHDKKPDLVNETEVVVDLPIIPTEKTVEVVNQQENIKQKVIQPPEQSESQDPEINYDEFEDILKSMKSICSTPPHLLDPIQDLSDMIFTSLFPQNGEILEPLDCPMSPRNVLDGYDLGHEPIEIPTENDEEVKEILEANVDVFTEFDTPKSPLSFLRGSTEDTAIDIPEESLLKPKKSFNIVGSIIDYNPKLRLNLVQWQQRRQITSKVADKRLCKIRKAIKIYLEDEWTDDNLEKCLDAIDPRNEFLLSEAIFETVDDNKSQKDINTDFTPPAPPLPHYQQKLILLIKKLSEENLRLPHKLIEDLEEKLFRFDNSAATLDELRNLSYYYSALVDLFFDSDHTMVFYFIVKCIYFYGYKAIPLVFVLIKAFPLTLPKKSTLLKTYSKGIDWENMTGLELSKVRLDFEQMDSLDLTVMYLLTCIQQFRRKAHESNVVADHELFNFLPKFYGFPLSFIAAPKLLEILVKRLEGGQLVNMSMSLILLAKRANPDFTIKTILEGNLMPLLKKRVTEMTSVSPEEIPATLVEQICMLVETISAILKSMSDEKEKSFKEVFPLIVSILGRVKHPKIQEYCVKAIIRLQRFIDNHQEVFTIIQHHQESHGSHMSEGLSYAIQTFIHRKNENFFRKIHETE